MSPLRKLVDIALQFLTVLLGLLLLLAYLSVFVKPTVFWFFGLLGLAYPVLLLLNLAFLVYWIIRWKWVFLYPTFAILLGISHFANFFQFPYGKGNQQESKDEITVVSYNVNLFQLYTWAKKPPTNNKIFTFLSNQNADIACLQEFYVVNNKFSERDAKAALSYNVHIGYINKGKKSGYGLATYSRYPIISTGEIRFENSANACIYSDIVIGPDTVRVYNNHLQSLRLKQNNLNFLKNQTAGSNSHAVDEIKDISYRYRDAVQKRAQQVAMVLEHIEQSPYPVIVCGDFNESPISYNYRKMRQDLNDAFVEAGAGVGHTYKGFFPSFRIDYILYHPNFTATSYSSPRVDYSDHYPVVATLRR